MASSVAVLAVIRAARPACRSVQDKVAFAVHAVCLSNGLKLIAVGSAADDPDAQASEVEVSHDGWNASAEQYSFLYKTTDGPTASLLMKCLVMDGTLLVSMVNITAGLEPKSAELDAHKYATDSDDLSASYKNTQELISQVEPMITDALGKESSVNAAVTTAEKQSSTTSQQHRLPASAAEQDPLRIGPPRRPDGFPGFAGPRSPLVVGGDDLLPGGLRPPGFVPGGIPFGPGGGMHVGPGHPFFSDRLRHPELHPPGGGGMPGMGPGGIRWDPIAPEGLPGWRPDDFQPERERRRGYEDIQQPGPGRGVDWDDMYG